jgi:hypothetical protein
MKLAELIDAELAALARYDAARAEGQTYEQAKPLLDAYRAARQAVEDAQAKRPRTNGAPRIGRVSKKW